MSFPADSVYPTVANDVFCDKRVGKRGRVSGGNSRGDIPIGTWKCMCAWSNLDNEVNDSEVPQRPL